MTSARECGIDGAMARPLRIEYEGAVYHITSRGNERKTIFKEDEDRELFLNILKTINDRFHWLCHAYCLMDNHYHLVIETPEGNLSKGMRQLNGVYTQAYNRRHRRVGHLFQGRYKAILVEKESYLLEVCRYVVLNPVRARAVKRVERWKWSSYRGTGGLEKPHGCLSTDWILERFSFRRVQAEREYRGFVRAGIGGSIWDKVKGQSLLGEEGFVERLRKYLEGREDIREIPRSQRYVGRPSLEQLLGDVELERKRERERKMVEAVEGYGYSQREIADYLGLHYSTISRVLNHATSRFKT